MDVSTPQAWINDWHRAPPGDYAVLGDPIAHSWSPSLHTAAYRALGLDLKYLAIRVPSGRLAQALDRLRGLGYRGVNCTVPLKLEAFAWAKDVDAENRAYGSLNALNLSTMAGTNTDAPGFLDTLEELDVKAPGPAVLLGAGGSARAVALALVRAGFVLRVFNRTRSRVEAMVRELGIRAEVLGSPKVHGAALIVDATAAHLTGAKTPIEWSDPAPGALAYTLAYADHPLPFLEEARTAGLRTTDGRSMLVAQAARSLEWWLGTEAPREAMLKAIP